MPKVYYVVIKGGCVDYGDRDLVAYLMAEIGCAHPFRISRALLLIDWIGKEKLGHKINRRLTYRFLNFGFYIEELPLVLDSLGKCVKKDEERKCYRYSCDKPRLPDEVKEILDDVLEKIEGFDDIELNRTIIKDRRYGV